MAMAAKKKVRQRKQSGKKRPAAARGAQKARRARPKQAAKRSKPVRRTGRKPVANAKRTPKRTAPRRTRAVPKPKRRQKPSVASRKKTAPRPIPTPARKKAAAQPVRTPPPKPEAPKANRPKASRPEKPAVGDRNPTRTAVPPVLGRARRQLSDEERGSLETERMLSAARTGSDELRHRLEEHTETSPTLTAGDVDANWGDAYAVGDEAPGGDNPTPDQDRVDDIGKALGVNYGAGEELQGSDKIAERDRHRWELDPASSDDWPHDKD
jgi:hypothetical protein